MSPPNIDAVLKAVDRIVLEGKRTQTLSQLTPRIIREKVEEEFSLRVGSLSEPEYKKSIKDAIAAAMDKYDGDASEDDDTGKPDETPSSPAEKTKKRKAKGDVEANIKTKKRKTVAPGKPTQEQPRRKPPSSNKFKSAEIVPTSDIEQDDPPEHEIVQPPPLLHKHPKPSSQTKRNLVEDHEPHKDSVAPSSKKGKPLPPLSPVVEDRGEKSDSELSVLLDEPPKRKGKGKSKDKDSSAVKTKGRRKAKSTPELSKDDETIKRLKSFVTACGVRKVWSKVFEGLDRPSQQISKLKEILADLGMTGRLSMEKAKAIREKRELAKELEDVKQFEQAVNAPPSRSRIQGVSKKNVIDSDTEGHSESGSNSDAEVPVKRKRNAQASIMAFLADQSDDE